MNVRKLSVYLLVLVLVVTSLGSYSAFAQDMVPDFPVKIEVIAPITGPAASIGEEQRNWAKLAVEVFNEETGWNVELVEGDTELDPAKAVLVAESAISDEDIYGAVGPATSDGVAATQQLFSDAGMVHISGSATRTSLTAEGFKTFFRTVPPDAVQGPTDGEYLANELGVTKLFVVDDQSDYATGLADEAIAAFEAAGGEIVGHESVTQDDIDFSALVTKIGSEGAEAVFFPGQLASQGALMGQQLQEQGLDVILFGADGFQQQEDFITNAGGATEGAYVSAFAPDIHDLESSADVVARALDEYGEFGTFGPPTYAATMVVLEAMQRDYEANGEITRAGVLEQVAATDQEVSILGTPMAFDENGDVLNAKFFIFIVQDGAFKLVPSGE